MLPQVQQLLKREGGVARLSDIVAVGCSKPTVAEYVHNGALERLAHGIYALKGELVDEQYVLQLRSPRIVFSHETALWMNGLSDRRPFELSVTVASGAPLALSMRGICRCHYVRRELVDEGIGLARTEFGHQVRCYSPERTLCDMVRDERSVGVEELTDGLKKYAARKEKRLPELMRLSALFGIEREMARYMGVLS